MFVDNDIYIYAADDSSVYLHSIIIMTAERERQRQTVMSRHAVVN